MALKVLTIGVLIYADVKIFLATKDINKDLQTIIKYFKTDGSFDEVKKNTIDLIKLFTIDVYNLITASRAVTLDIRQTIYMGAMIGDTANTDLIATSKEFDPENLSMGETFMTAMRNVVTQMSTVQPTSSSQYTAALETIKGYLEPLKTDYNIFDRFSTFASSLSILLGGVGFAI